MMHNKHFSSGFVAIFLCVFISSSFMLFSNECVHWFIIPITLCGIILVKDARNWFAGKLDVFDPVGFIAILGFYFFFLAPILHVYWNSWMRYVVPPIDWRPWLGYMGILNILGLLSYKSIIVSKRWKQDKSLRIQWILREQRFWAVCGFALLLTMAIQVYVYHSFGGVLGYIYAYIDRSSAFQGMGWIFMISESFPILAFMAYAIAAKKNETLRQWIVIIFVIIIFIGLRLIFGGMRGSRSNTVWALFWAVGIIHFWIRPVNKRIVVSGLIALFVFMYSYGLYKSHGLEGLHGFINPLQRSNMAVEGGRTFDKTLLGDFGRSDVQAYLLYRIFDSDNQYSYKWGQTYINSLMLLVPKPMRPNILGKREAGTEAQYGYYSDVFLSSRIYGLAGEAMLNWGVVSIPIAFVLFALIVAKLRRFIKNVSQNDVRILFIPFIINLVIILLTADSDNVIFFIIKNGSIPFLVLWISSTKLHIRHLHGN